MIHFILYRPTLRTSEFYPEKPVNKFGSHEMTHAILNSSSHLMLSRIRNA